jgi:polar amino acid transport system ATP-binding protein
MTLELTNLSKAFGATVVLEDLTLKIEGSKSLVLIGPSGGGKTTLLRLMAGLEEADQGTLRINDHRLDREEKRLREYRKKVGIVFQNYNLFPHLTALENILLPLVQVHRWNREEAREEVMALLGRFNLEEHALKKPAALSGGQQQRIAICRAVAARPELLLLDEPTSALDPEYTSEVLDLIGELRTEGMELVLVTHEIGFAQEVGDQILFVADGGVLQHGGVDEVLMNSANPRVQAFLSKVLKHHTV